VAATRFSFVRIKRTRSPRRYQKRQARRHTCRQSNVNSAAFYAATHKKTTAMENKKQRGTLTMTITTDKAAVLDAAVKDLKNSRLAYRHDSPRNRKHTIVLTTNNEAKC
jgi:hypothetical protein